jgi:hypothetical protein
LSIFIGSDGIAQKPFVVDMTTKEFPRLIEATQKILNGTRYESGEHTFCAIAASTRARTLLESIDELWGSIEAGVPQSSPRVDRSSVSLCHLLHFPLAREQARERRSTIAPVLPRIIGPIFVVGALGSSGVVREGLE